MGEVTFGGQKLTCTQMREMDLCLGEHCCRCIAYAPKKSFIGAKLRSLVEKGKLVCNLVASII